MTSDKPITIKTGLLILNLGSPDSADPAAVRRYLVEFLSDPRVIDLPRWFWIPLLRFVIAPLRAYKTARAYRKIWTAGGSPLVVLTVALADKLRRALSVAGSQVITETAMCIGTPDISRVLARLDSESIEQLVVLPLYPQYSATTTESAFDAVRAHYQGKTAIPELKLIRHYYDRPAWSAALAASIQAWWHQHGRAELLIFSFHGLPERYITAGDPYQVHCEESTRNIVAELQLGESEFLQTFQSRVGAEKWLEPYTDKELVRLAESGVKRVQVVCPGFAIDCLETLEEIVMQNRDLFIAAGGESLEYIPALNDSDDHVNLLLALLAEYVPRS